MRLLTISLAALLALAILAPMASAGTVTVLFDPGTTNVTTALTGFATDGAMMDGMAVTAVFGSGAMETAFWADTGATSGAASGTGWALSESGDTFGGDWVLTNTAALGIQKILIDAGVGDTVFDRNFSPSTAGSASGLTFTLVSDTGDHDVTATYSDLVALSGFSPVGDLYRRLQIEFTNGTFDSTNTYVFHADTDNLNLPGDLSTAVPLPAPLWLGFTMLGGLGLVRRIRRRKLA